jgi:hypothetical protein
MDEYLSYFKYGNSINGYANANGLGDGEGESNGNGSGSCYPRGSGSGDGIDNMFIKRGNGSSFSLKESMRESING